MERVVTVFGSARSPEGEEEYRLAFGVGTQLARAGFTVCNGGYAGSMEASARGAKESGGKTIGVTFKNSFKRDPNRWIDQEIFCTTLVERMMKLIELGDAYVVLKGGTGTLLELAAVWEFINKGLLKEKPIVIVGKFWTSVVDTLREELLWEGAGDCTKFIHSVTSPEECAAFLTQRLR
jgi:uncharacterized protein (TIGR00730 family)